jgi:hypothetical protein
MISIFSIKLLFVSFVALNQCKALMKETCFDEQRIKWKMQKIIET